MTFNTLSAAGQRWARAAAITTLGVAALAAAGAAQARDDVFWSIGLASPGVQVGLSNAGQVYVQPAPVYVQPAPVYVQPRPVYVQPAPVYAQPAPVYYRPAPVVYGWVPPGHRHHGHHGHAKHHQHAYYDQHPQHDRQEALRWPHQEQFQRRDHSVPFDPR